MRDQLQDVLDAAATGTPAPAWESAVSRIAEERRAVEQRLRSTPGEAVYGFTTMLGPLDGVPAEAATASSLLEAHLVGTPEPLTPAMTRLVTATKLSQLSSGGSGISAATYRRLLGALRTPPPCGIDWSASYGSADVVPASWWVRALVPDADVLETGDLVALINGHFVSTAHSVSSTLRLADYLGDFCAAAGMVCVPTRRTGLAEGERLLAESMAGNYLPVSYPRQLPVSVRDSAAFVLPVVSVLEDLADSLALRVGRPSANPLFLMDGGSAEPVSQASFLDVGLTLRLCSARQFVLYCMGAMQRFTEALCGRLSEGLPAEDPRLVQPPKVSQAILEGARAAAGPVTGFSGSQSGGVEDLWDCSLIASRSLTTAVEAAVRQLDVLLGVLRAWDMRPAAGGAHFTGLLLGTVGLRLPGTLSAGLLSAS